MRIFTLVNEFPPGPGGLGTHAYEMVMQLIKYKHEVLVVGPQNYATEDTVMSFNARQPFEIISNTKEDGRLLTIPRRIFKTLNLFRNYRPDMIIASGSNAIWMSMCICIFSNTKFVVVAHGGELTFASGWRKKLTRLGCRMADGIVSVSQYTADILLRDGVPKEKVRVILNGANHNFFKNLLNRDELKRRYGLFGKKVLITVGSVSERKGQDVVIRAMAKVVAAHPNVVYLMAGRSNNFQFYEEIAESVRVRKHVKFLDIVSNADLLNYYNLADLFVLTSRHSSDGDFEGFGIVVIEAALCGIPSVVTDGSGLIEAVEVNQTGFVVKPDDIEGTANAIIRLLTDEALRQKMGQSAQSRAEEKFTWSVVGRKYHEYIESLAC